VFHKNPIYTNTFHQSIRFEYDDNNNVNTGQYVIDVEDGKVILFPSHLEHSVEQNNTNEIRYSLAFNFLCKRKIW
jgi:ectoine hydroxylase-related dioxygenase (phytanoyl-CoA dioxygenase family)